LPKPTLLRPLENRILVDMVPEDNTTESGLTLPKNFKQLQAAPARAKVLAVGPGRWEGGARCPMTVKVGDVVLMHPMGGTTVSDKEGEKTLRVIPEHELVGILH
jgi:chaperonin GroES